jgi:exopolysaccharide production protein ExoZ
MRVQSVKFASIQILRAIAAIMVLISHLIFAIEYAGIPCPIYHIGSMADTGLAGVMLFFGISGFIVTYIGRKSVGNPYQGLIFFIRRILRVFPIYWITTFIAILLWKAGIGFRSTNVTIGYLIKSLLCFPMPRSPIIDQGWSLPYEIYFYVIFSLGLVLFSNFTRIIIACGIWFLLTLAASQLLPESDALRFLGSVHILSFMMGSLLGFLFCRGVIPASKKIANILCFCSIGAFIGIYCLFPKVDVSYLVKSTPLYLALAGAVFHLNPLGKAANLISKIGDASYSIYLTQGFFVMALPRILKHFSEIQTLNPMMILIPSFVFIVACGYVFWMFVENPIQIAIQTRLNRIFNAGTHKI